jgi:hypothetical protein
VLANVAAFVQLKGSFLQILAIAECNRALAGVALRIIAQMELPVGPGRERHRLLAVLKHEIAHGDDVAVTAAARIVQKLSFDRELRVKLTKELGFDRALVESVMKQNDPYTFIALMQALDNLEVTMTSQSLSLFDQMVMKAGSGLQASPEFIELRTRIRSKMVLTHGSSPNPD